MTGINTYSTTASNNVQANTGVNWDEGMSPAAVNNSARQDMADLRTAFNDLAWFQYGKGDGPYSPVYQSSTQFKVAGADVTAAYHIGRRVRAVGSSTGTIYGTIAASSYSTDTLVTVRWDSGSLSNETLTISLSQIPITGAPAGGAFSSSGDGSSLDAVINTTLPGGLILKSGYIISPGGTVTFATAFPNKLLACWGNANESGTANINVSAYPTSTSELEIAANGGSGSY